MKAKPLALALAGLLAAGGLWLAWSARRTPASQQSSLGAGSENQGGPNGAASMAGASQTGSGPGPTHRPKPGQMLRPPNPTQKFIDFTPEQRVEFARRGQGPGG